MRRTFSEQDVASLAGYIPGETYDNELLTNRLRAMGFELQRQPGALSNIDSMLADGCLVIAPRHDGANHAMLVLDKIENSYEVHDIGPDPQANRKLSAGALAETINEGAEITGFKLKDRRNLRLDQYVIGQYPTLSRSYAVRLIDEGRVRVNDKPSKAGYKLREDDDITIEYDPGQATAIPSIDLPVIYEDDDCIVINKPAGILTHSVGKLHGEATVATFLRERLHGDMAQALPTIQGIRNAKVNQDNLRAGIVHRLDRATSGVIICAKTPQALSWLQKQFHDRTAEKTYSALVRGHLNPAAAMIDMPIARNPKAPATFRVDANGKPAVTKYETIASNDRYSLLELRPATGRTHQLRVHLAHQKHPIVGDYMYGGEKADRLYLHARQLRITLPNGTQQVFVAELPQAFTQKAS